jgi:hypothetical protein
MPRWPLAGVRTGNQAGPAMPERLRKKGWGWQKMNASLASFTL